MIFLILWMNFFHGAVHRWRKQSGPIIVPILACSTIFIHRNSSQLCPHPVQQFMATVAATMYPRTLPMIEIEPSHLVHHHEGWRQGGHQRPEGRSRHRKIISIGNRRRLEKNEERQSSRGAIGRWGRTPLQLGRHSPGSLA